MIEDPRYFVMQVLHLNNVGLWKTLWPPDTQSIRRRLQKITRSTKYNLTRLEQGLINDKKRFLKNYCNLYPFQIVKLVRLPLRAIKILLQKSR